MTFLSPAELQQLTGYETARYQKRWLIMNRWIFGLDARKRPIVLRRYAEQRLGVGDAAPATKTKVNLKDVA